MMPSTTPRSQARAASASPLARDVKAHTWS